jgi:hypothetical protein
LIWQFETDILVEVIKGKIDLNLVVLKELQNRGLDRDGQGVGF